MEPNNQTRTNEYNVNKKNNSNESETHVNQIQNISSTNRLNYNVGYSGSVNHIQNVGSAKKIRWGLIIIIISAVLVLLAVLYYLFFVNKSLLGNLFSGNDFNFTKTESGVNGNFYYNSNLDGLIYQSTDGKIYGDYYDIDQKHYLTFNPLGAKLVSLSPVGNKAVIYYQDNAVLPSSDKSNIAKTVADSLKNSKGNYYLADLEKNEMFLIGTGLSSFMWSNDKLYTIRNGFEVLCYDFRIANYTPAVYQGPIEPYNKSTDLTYTLYFADILPGTDTIYMIVEKNNSRSLTAFNANEKQFSKIMDTSASSIMFSPTGKYYALFDNDNKKTVIYNSSDNNPLYTISNEVVMPMKIVWDLDKNLNEDKLFYLSSTDKDNAYYGLNEYDLASKINSVLFTSADKKFSDPTNLEINSTKKILYFSSDKNDNIYELEVK